MTDFIAGAINDQIANMLPNRIERENQPDVVVTDRLKREAVTIVANNGLRSELVAAYASGDEALATFFNDEILPRASDLEVGRSIFATGRPQMEETLGQAFDDTNAGNRGAILRSIQDSPEAMRLLGSRYKAMTPTQREVFAAGNVAVEFDLSRAAENQLGAAIMENPTAFTRAMLDGTTERFAIQNIDALELGRMSLDDYFSSIRRSFPDQDTSAFEAAVRDDPDAIRALGNGLKQAGSIANLRARAANGGGQGLSEEDQALALRAAMRDPAGFVTSSVQGGDAAADFTIENSSDIDLGRRVLSGMAETQLEGIDNASRDLVLESLAANPQALAAIGSAYRTAGSEDAFRERVTASLTAPEGAEDGPDVKAEERAAYVVTAAQDDAAGLARAMVGEPGAGYQYIVQSAVNQEMAEVNTVAASAANDPVTAGRNIIGTVGEAMDINDDIINALKADEALMERVGRDLARNAQAATQQGQAPVAQELINIQKLLNGEEVSGVSLLDYAGQYPSLMGAMLNAQYQQDAAGTVDMIQTTMSENLGNFSAEEQARIMAGFEGEGATTKLNEILADPEKASQMMSNISYLAGMGEGEMSPEDRETLVRSLAENSERWLYAFSSDDFLQNVSLLVPDAVGQRIIQGMTGFGDGFGTVNIFGMEIDLSWADGIMDSMTDPRQLRFMKGWAENKMLTFGQSFEMVGSVFSGTEGMPFMGRMNRSYGAFTQTRSLFDGRVGRIHGTPRPQADDAAAPQVAVIDTQTGDPVVADTSGTGSGSGGDSGAARPQVAQNDVANPTLDPAIGT